MAYYYTICEVCDYQDEDFEKPMSVDFPVKCPSCKKKKLIQNYSIPKNTIYKDSTPRTIGQQSDLNKKKMGKELTQLKEESMLTEHDKAKKNAKKPWYWSENQTKPLDVSNLNITKYVETGEK